MSGESRKKVRRARVLGPGAILTLECPRSGERLKMRVTRRSGRALDVEPLHGGNPVPCSTPGSEVLLRVARPFGLFLYRGKMERAAPVGAAQILLSEAPPRRRQLRHFFRMRVRMGVVVESNGRGGTAPVLRASNLSGSGILLMDPQGRLALDATARVGLPIGTRGEIARLDARVVRVETGPPRRAALCFEGIGEATRKAILRYLVREHRRRLGAPAGEATPGKIICLGRSA